MNFSLWGGRIHLRAAAIISPHASELELSSGMPRIFVRQK